MNLFRGDTKKEMSNNIKTNKELAELISIHLPITEEHAERFIDASLKGYVYDEFSGIDYGIALSFRDKIIDELRTENQKLMKALYNKI